MNYDLSSFLNQYFFQHLFNHIWVLKGLFTPRAITIMRKI